MMNVFFLLFYNPYSARTHTHTYIVKVNKHHHLREMMNQHLISLRSEETTTSIYSRLAIILIDGGMKVVQEKNDASEMFAIKLNLFDLHWHQIAFRYALNIVFYAVADVEFSFKMMIVN